MRKLLRLLPLMLILLFNKSYAQQFDWVTGGGTLAEDTWLDAHPEATYFMCTDANGNIYALSAVGNDPITADTFYDANGPYGADANFMITSYTCSGQIRWAKLIASSAGPCLPYGIVADSTGHVYVAGFLTNATLHIGNDTAISGLQYVYNGVMQFDTSGHFNWVRYVGDDNLNNAFNSVGFGSTILLDGNENVHFINFMRSGVDIMPGITSQFGDYDLVYNVTGNLLSATRLSMDSVWYVNEGSIDPVTNKLYVYGERNQGIIDTFAAFAAAFDLNRNMLWMDTIGNNAGAFTGITYDKMGHLYFSISTDISFMLNDMSVPAGISAIVKTDTNGDPIWLQGYHISGTSVFGMSGITLLPNNLVVGEGIYAGQLSEISGPFSLTTPAGEGQNPFITVLDTSGTVMSLKSLHGDGLYNWALSITSDKVGNIYIGGQVADSIWATNTTGNISPYVSVGGNTDFFIMKYGVDCNCTSMPVANYSDTGTAATRGFTYTGTTQGIDSVVWNFGDGSATVNSMSPVTHTYDSGSYEACVYAYSACGSDMHCSRVSYLSNEGITNIQDIGVSVYPNPATDELKITTQSSGISYKLMSITGVYLTSGSLKQGNNNVSLSGFASGIYVLEMKDGNGQVKVVRVVKD